MCKYIIINIVGMIVLTLTLFSYNNVIVSEEVNPIRENDIITSMNYNITLDKKTNKKSFDIKSSILSSIYHYKDIDSIDTFTINLYLINDTKYNYSIDRILLVDNNYIIREIECKKIKNKIVFNLNKEDFNSNYFIKLKIKR